MPCSPRTGEAASVTDPSTWGSFAEALAAHRRGGWDGIGYVFTKDDPYTGIDFDNCIEAGQLAPRVAAWIATAGSYAERSPSGTGVKLIVRATLPGAGARKEALGLEIYDQARFFTLTGDVLDGCPSTIAAAQALADEVHRACGGGQAQTAAGGPAPVTEAPEPMLSRGGPLRRPDGTLRRLRPEHWLNRYIAGDNGPYLQLAAARGWDTSDSGVRFHGYETLWHFGYPEDEIALIARALFPERQGRSARWWQRETHNCLHGEHGAATRDPGRPRRASRGFSGSASEATPSTEAPKRPGRPKVLDAGYLLRWYGEEAGKRPLEGPRRHDAEALGVSVPTMERLDAQLAREGAIKIELLPKRAGRRVVLLGQVEAHSAAGAIKIPPADRPLEVPSEIVAAGAIDGIVTPQDGDHAPQCIEVSQGSEGAPPAGDAAPPPQPVPPPAAAPAPAATLRQLVAEAVDAYGPHKKRVARYVADNGGERFAPAAVDHWRRKELERRRHARADAALVEKAESRGPKWRKTRMRSLELTIAGERNAGRLWVWLRQYAIVFAVHEGRQVPLNDATEFEILANEARAYLDELREATPAPLKPRVDVGARPAAVPLPLDLEGVAHRRCAAEGVPGRAGLVERLRANKEARRAA